MTLFRTARPSRITVALLALFCVLFAQLAIAAYACPGLLPEQATRLIWIVADATDPDSAQDCADMDMAQPALCQAHAQAGDQSLDKPASPHPSPSAAILLVPGAGNLHAAHHPPVAYADAPFLAWTTPPPVTVRHCCFRL